MINTGKATDKLSLRGPDSRGSFVDDFVALGHRRLSIIDTSSNGRQPFHDPTERYVMVFNGEIFNYKDLKKELLDKGITFTSDSDTEVLLHLYILEGEKCLNKLVGFFAFSIYDKQEKSLFIARDRFGVKPLVYYYDEDKFVFSSELKSLLAYNIPRKLDNVAVYTYLQLRYIPGEATIFQDIHKLLPGHWIKIKDKKVTIQQWYQLPYSPATAEKNTLSYEEQQKKLEEILEDAVKLRLIADVPLGAFLSGGIDSSVIVALASRHTDHLKTFSIGFHDEPMFDETRYAGIVADHFKTDHTVFSLTTKDLLDHVFPVLDYLDEPFADSAALPLHILSQQTAQKVKVALSGDGADELFGGYNKHLAELMIRENRWQVGVAGMIHPFIKNMKGSRNSKSGDLIRKLNRLADGKSLGAASRYWQWCGVSSEKAVRGMLNQTFLDQTDVTIFQKRQAPFLQYLNKKSNINDVLRSDLDLLIPNQMMYKADMMSMANGLEVRVPFLDHRVAEYAFSLPTESKIKGNFKKRLVQDTFRNILPEELYQRPKHGFDVPMMKWFGKELFSLIHHDLLSDRLIEEQGIFDPQYIRSVKEQLKNGQAIDQEQVWTLIVFQYWWKKYLQGHDSSLDRQ